MSEMLLTANAFTITAYHPLLDTFDINSLCFENVFILENWFIHEMIFTSSFRSVTFRLDESFMNQHTKDKSPLMDDSLDHWAMLDQGDTIHPYPAHAISCIPQTQMLYHPQRPNLTFAIDVLSQKVLKCCWSKAEADRQRLIKVCLWCTSDLFLL